MNKYLLIINPVSGNKTGSIIADKIKKKLYTHNFSVDCLITEYKGHATEYLYNINKDTYQSIITIGGDGTYHEVINGILKRTDDYNPVLGFIPGGTGNSLMHDLNCLDPEDALKPILNNQIQKLDVMELKFDKTTEYAFNILGWGLATDIGLSAEKIRWLGSSRYTVASLLHILKLNKRSATIILDNKKYSDDFIFILICNTIYTGNAMMAAPKAKIGDGLFDVIIINKAITRFQLLKLLPLLFKGEHIHSPYVEYQQVKKIVLEPKHNEILNIDGEIKNYTPVAINVLKQKFSIYN